MLITLELDRSAHEDRIDDYDEDETPVSLAEIEASVKRVLGADVPLRPVSPDAPLDLRRFYGINSRIASGTDRAGSSWSATPRMSTPRWAGRA